MDIEDEILASGEEIRYAGEELRSARGQVVTGKVPLNVYGY